MMKKLMKSCLFMAAVMAVFLTVFPITAHSATVATIGNRRYSSLSSALKAARSGQTVKLKKNASFDMQYYDKLGNFITAPTYKKKITLDLNKKKLTVTDHSMGKATGVSIPVNKKLTIKNGTIVGGILVGKGGDLTLTNVKFKHGNLTKYSDLGCWQGGKLKATGCSSDCIEVNIYGNKSKGVFSNCTFSGNGSALFMVGQADNSKSTVEIKSGKYTYNGTEYLFNIQPSGNVTVKGGTFSSAGKSHGNVIMGTMNLKGGNFTSGMSAYCHVSGKMNISGGKLVLGNDYMGACIQMFSGSTVKMTGGSISSLGIDSSGIGIDGMDNAGNLTVTGGSISSQYKFAILGPSKSISVGSNAKLSAPGETIHYTDDGYIE